MMNSKDFALAYSVKYCVSYKCALRDCEKFWGLLKKLLYEDKENVTIYGLGSFRHQIKKARKVRHPETKEIIVIPESIKIKFTQSSTRWNRQDFFFLYNLLTIGPISNTLLFTITIVWFLKSKRSSIWSI